VKVRKIRCKCLNPKKNDPKRHVTSFVTRVISNNSIEVSWVAAENADKYLLQAKTGSGDFELFADGMHIEDDLDWSNENATLNVSQTSVIFEELTARTTYDFIIHPYNQNGIPDPNYKTNGKVPTSSASTTDEPVAHVSEFISTALSSTSVLVSWIDADKVEKYVVLAKTGDEAFLPLSDGQMVAEDHDWEDNNSAMNVAQDVQEVTFSGLAANTEYEFIIYPYSHYYRPNLYHQQEAGHQQPWQIHLLRFSPE